MPSSKAMYRLIPTADPFGIVPPQPTEGDAGVALAFVVALLRALRDRGTLSRAEVDDVLTDVQDQVSGKGAYLVDAVRRDLEREEDDLEHDPEKWVPVFGKDHAPGISLNEPALHHRCLDERGEQRVRRERSRLELRVELHADEPRMIVVFDDLRQHAVR